MVSGLLGVPLGQLMACKLKQKYPQADPLICGFGLLVSAPLLFVASLLPTVNTSCCFFFIFLGEISLNMNWSIVADMLLVSLFHFCLFFFAQFFFRISFSFGWIAMLAGLLGVPLGSYLSQKCRLKTQKADPIICGIGLLISTPLFAAAMLIARYHLIICYILIFFGQLAINLNWSIVADILLVRRDNNFRKRSM